MTDKTVYIPMLTDATHRIIKLMSYLMYEIENCENEHHRQLVKTILKNDIITFKEIESRLDNIYTYSYKTNMVYDKLLDQKLTFIFNEFKELGIEEDFDEIEDSIKYKTYIREGKINDLLGEND